ncbi:MAG TPA: NAD-dependent epimerase/dehydratase family protein [Bryobacteraceae bacterium]|nr:NAD-dependent epimerase/dehydratase family protein [Bryobacteraceae bacterium]
MKWLITGGGGFIGTNAAETLVRAGDRCVLADNFHRAGAKYNQEYLREHFGLGVDYLDVRFPDQVNSYWQAHTNTDVVLHLAGQVSLVASIENPRYDFDTNALGTFNVLEATRRFLPKAKLIYASTNKVYGDLRGLDVTEDATRYRLPDFPEGLAENLPIDLHGGYSCSKGAADQYALDYHRVYGLSTVALRQSSIYGGRQYASEDQGWVSYFVQMGVERRKFRISGDGKQVRDLLHVSDLIECYRAIAKTPRESLAFGQAFNIGGGPRASLSLVELFTLLESEYAFPMNYTAGPPRAGDQKVFIADIRKATQYLGWRPSVAIDEGMEELVEWSKGRWAA